jgi:outer membrane protein assembly factor BamB
MTTRPSPSRVSPLTRMSCTAALGCLALALRTPVSQGAVGDDDWPTYNHDARRSAVSLSSLDVPKLEPRWVYSSKMPAQPAWPGPAKRDYYNSPTVDNEDRLDFDSVYHVAAVGDSVLFGSSGEDSLRCLDARDGQTRWVYTTDGPVRFAPHVVGERVYFGSDDGCIYCLRASDGELLWKRRAAPGDYQVPSDGKMISLWPNRSGVIVQDGIVYCGVGVFPSEGVYVCALDAETGRDSGPGLFSSRYTDMSLQGYVLASPGRLYFPGGRAGPWIFDRKTGERGGQVGGGGGTYALITSDESIIYGPGETSAVLEEFQGQSRDKLASFPGARHMVVTPERSYINTRQELLALDRARYLELSAELHKLTEQREKLDQESAEHKQLGEKIAQLDRRRQDCFQWKVACDCSDALILAGDYLVAGGPNAVAAYRASNGSEVWRRPVQGIAKGLAAARGRLFVSTDQRRIHCFQ